MNVAKNCHRTFRSLFLLRNSTSSAYFKSTTSISAKFISLSIRPCCSCNYLFGGFSFSSSDFAQGHRLSSYSQQFRSLRTFGYELPPSRFNRSVESINGTIPLRLYSERKSDVLEKVKSESSGTAEGDEKKNNGKGQKEQQSSSTGDAEDLSKMTLFQRFKYFWKKYWYVVIPVHMVNCSIWFGLFYYISVSGVDIAGILESFGVSSKVVELIRKYPAGGHFAIAAALYKIITPVRYAVTIGITYVAIKYLARLGYIRPMPSRKQIATTTASLTKKAKTYFEKRKHNYQAAKRKKHPKHKNGNGNGGSG